MSAPGDEQPVSFLRAIGAVFVPGSELAAADGPPLGGAAMAGMASYSDEDEAEAAPGDGKGQRGSERFKGRKPLNSAQSDPETDEFAQPSDGDGVSDDMATLVLDNPALGRGPALTSPEPQRPVNYAQDESCDAAGGGGG